MQSLKNGVLLGTLLIFGLLSGQVVSQEPDTYCTLQTSQPEQLTWSNNVSFSCQSSFYPESFFVTSSVPVTMLDVARANIDEICSCLTHQYHSQGVMNIFYLSKSIENYSMNDH
ncbi:MAG: hypothetical protein CL947_00745 [Epsilonproteobacteria bacterium]|nr:hypothetical protein [Campylobacterota bacterium]